MWRKDTLSGDANDTGIPGTRGERPLRESSILWTESRRGEHGTGGKRVGKNTENGDHVKEGFPVWMKQTGWLKQIQHPEETNLDNTTLSPQDLEKFEKVQRYVRGARMLLTELANAHNGQPVGVLFHNQSVYVGSAEKELRSLARRLGLE
jgi:hypothetical protein